MRVKFADTLKIINGKNQQKVEDLQGKYPIYGSGGIMGYANDYICPAETVIIGRKGSINKPIFADTPFWNVDTAFGLCADKAKLFPKYLYYFCVNFDFERLNTTVTIPSLTKSNLLNIEIPLPPLDEQRRIAAVLDKVSDLIAKRREQLDKLDELVKARFVEMFGNCNYPRQPLISLIKEGTGLSYGIVQPGDDGTGDLGVIRPVDMVDGNISIDSIKHIDRAIGDSFKKTELTGDELLITVRGTTGITALTDVRFKGMNVTRGIAVIRYNRSKINPAYLNAYLNTAESQNYIQEHTRGATLQQINLSDLRIQEILLPPMYLQEHFSDYATLINKSKLTIQQSLDKMETLKKALMQEYFG